jgi:hypothetical protein
MCGLAEYNMWGKMCGHGVNVRTRLISGTWGKMCGHGVKCADNAYKLISGVKCADKAYNAYNVG